MRNLRFWLITLIAALVVPSHTPKPAFALPFICQGDEPQVMVHVDGAYARHAASWQSAPIGRVFKFQCYRALGRDDTNEWVLLAFGTSYAWINRVEVRFADGADITQLAPASRASVPKANLPVRLPGVPAITAQHRQMYQQAIRARRDPNAVTVIGDCNSEYPVFFGRLATGAVDLSSNPALSTVVQRFARSFARQSLATNGGFNTASPLDPTWTDTKVCNKNESPAACELRLSNASLVIVSLGTGDTFTWREFEQHYTELVDFVRKAGAVPILMTKADALESRQGGAPADHINTVIRQVGARYGLPVIDFALAARALPNNGLAIERDDDMKQKEPFHVSDLGADVRILMTLQTLQGFTPPPQMATRTLTPTPRSSAAATPTPRSPAATPTPRPRGSSR